MLKFIDEVTVLYLVQFAVYISCMSLRVNFIKRMSELGIIIFY